MPSLKYVIELNAEEKAKLTDIVTKGKSPARTILRANILLAFDRGNETYIPNLTALRSLLLPWTSSRNSAQKGVDWHFSTNDARSGLKHLYPVVKI